jgi:hypothetical protein
MNNRSVQGNSCRTFLSVLASTGIEPMIVKMINECELRMSIHLLLNVHEDGERTVMDCFYRVPPQPFAIKTSCFCEWSREGSTSFMSFTRVISRLPDCHLLLRLFLWCYGKIELSDCGSSLRHLCRHFAVTEWKVSYRVSVTQLKFLLDSFSKESFITCLILTNFLRNPLFHNSEDFLALSQRKTVLRFFCKGVKLDVLRWGTNRDWSSMKPLTNILLGVTL